MELDRRRFVLLTGAQATACAARGLPALAAQQAKPAFLILRDMNPSTPEPTARAFVEPLTEAQIPFGIALGSPRATKSKAAAPSLASLWAELLEGAPQLAEWVVDVPDLAQLTPYFQRRAVSNAIETVAFSFEGTLPAGSRLVPPTSLICDAIGPARSYPTTRALGIRNLFERGKQPRFAASVLCDNSMACLRGGHRANFETTIDDVTSWISQPAQGGQMLVLEHSFDGAELVSRSAARQRGEAIAAAIVGEVQNGRAFFVAPREHAKWFSETSKRTVSVLVEQPLATETAAGHPFDELMKTLETAGFQPTVARIARVDQSDAEFACIRFGVQADLDPREIIASRSAAGRITCATVPELYGLETDLPDTGLTALVPATDGTHAEFGPDGLLRLGNVFSAKELPAISGDQALSINSGDLLVVISPTDVPGSSNSGLLPGKLEALRTRQDTEFVSLPAYLKDVVQDDPVFEIYQSARGFETRTPDQPTDPLYDRAKLLGDARQAWSYIDQTTTEKTGLCPATVHFLPDGNWLYRQLTMWDLGSLIFAVLAAHEIGLIEDAELEWRAEALVNALPTIQVGARRLPSEAISTERTASLSSDFNVCDTGRLLSALRHMMEYPRISIAERIERIVTSWDLESVILDGRMHSVRAGRLIPRSRSHCAHYTALGFRHWGISVPSPYEVTDGLRQADADMQILYAAADIGAIGAEPLLFEAIEYGSSPSLEVLSKVLFAAQWKAHHESGLLYAVSEAPLNTEPWFTYQGLRLADRQTRWNVETKSVAPEHQGDQFKKQILLVNSKAAFLWYATQPASYSQQLVNSVREKAVNSSGGFTPGYFATNGEPMANYADINTNGVILQSIAFILRNQPKLK